MGGPSNTRRANLKWQVLGKASSPWNRPIHAGIFLENGCITFYRQHEGNWHSSGIICADLPERVRPCMFMCSFSGYAHVRFSNLWTCAPPICECCDKKYQGLRNGWTRLKPVS